MRIPYDKHLKAYARRLRNESTLPEILFWQRVKGKSLGYQFYRQRPLLHYIVDFYCPKLKLVVEIDGSSHDSAAAQAYDRRREEKLMEYGLTFIRFDNATILRELDGAIWALEAKIAVLEVLHGLKKC